MCGIDLSSFRRKLFVLTRALVGTSNSYRRLARYICLHLALQLLSPIVFYLCDGLVLLPLLLLLSLLLLMLRGKASLRTEPQLSGCHRRDVLGR